MSSSSSALTSKNSNYAPGGSNAVDDVNQIVTKNGSSVQGVQDQINVASGDLGNVVSLLQETQKELGQQQDKVNTARTKATGLQQQMAQLQTDPKGNKDAIAKLQPQLDAANADLAQQQQKLDQLTAAAQGLSDQIGQIKSKLDTLRSQTLPQATAKDKASSDAQVRADADKQAQKANDAISKAEGQADSAKEAAKPALSEQGGSNFSAQQNVQNYQQFYTKGLQATSSLDIPYLDENQQGKTGTGTTASTGTGGVTN